MHRSASSRLLRLRVPGAVPPEYALLRLDVPAIERIRVAAVLQADLDGYGVEPAVCAAVKTACCSTAASFG